MGDTGAMIIGLLLAMLTIRFINLNYSLSSENLFRFDSTITTAVCLIIIPLFDTLRIFILRMSKGLSPFSPDKNHIHHALMRLGMSHAKATITLTSVQLFYILMAIAFRNVGDRIMLPLVIIVTIILSLSIDRLIRNKKNLKILNR